MNTAAWFLAGILIGLLISDTYQKPRAPVIEDLQREHEAYRLCMQSASRVGCSMTPADFVRYYQIEDQIRVMSESS